MKIRIFVLSFLFLLLTSIMVISYGKSTCECIMACSNIIDKNSLITVEKKASLEAYVYDDGWCEDDSGGSGVLYTRKEGKEEWSNQKNVDKNKLPETFSEFQQIQLRLILNKQGSTITGRADLQYVPACKGLEMFAKWNYHDDCSTESMSCNCEIFQNDILKKEVKCSGDCNKKEQYAFGE